MKNKLSSAQQEELLKTLKTRFEKNRNRHKGIEWPTVQDRLEKNADNLREVNAEVRQQVERGVFDIEVVKRANDQLIATIEDSLRIADEGKAKRRDAEQQLVELEGKLKESLSAASARAAGKAPPAPPSRSA